MTDSMSAPMPPPMAPPMASPQQSSMNMTGLAISVIGGALLVIGWYALDWYSFLGAKYDYTAFHNAAKLPGAPGWGDAYFTWLGMTALIVAIVLALAANAGLGFGSVLGPLGLLVSWGGLVGGVFALKQAWDSWSDVFKHTSAGLWLWMVGFLITGIGAAAGGMKSMSSSS